MDVVTLRGSFTLVAPRATAGSWFAGSLAALSFAEVAQLVTSTLRSGLLLLSFASSGAAGAGGPGSLRRKAISFRDGQVVFASSSDPAERLGAVLWRAGFLGLEDLDRAVGLARAGRPLGQVLVEEKLLGSAQVYEGIVRQVREIVLGCFHEKEGEFVFREGPHDERNAVRLPERTRDLLLAGARRAEEIDLVRAEVPDLEAPLLRRGEAPRGLDFKAERLLTLADGRALRQALADAQLGLYDGLRAAASLARLGAVDPRASRASARDAAAAAPAPAAAAAPAAASETDPPEHGLAWPARGAAGAFETYRGLFARIYFALRAAVPDARERLNAYLERLPPRQLEFFHGVRLDGEGNLDGARVLLNVNASGLWVGATARARALEALDAFLTFALFEAKNVLSALEYGNLKDEVARLAGQRP